MTHPAPDTRPFLDQVREILCRAWGAVLEEFYLKDTEVRLELSDTVWHGSPWARVLERPRKRPRMGVVRRFGIIPKRLARVQAGGE